MNEYSAEMAIETIRRGWISMSADARKMLVAVGTDIDPTGGDGGLMIAVKEKFGDNSKYFGFICGTHETLAKAEARVQAFDEDPTSVQSLRANADKAKWNAARFHEMAGEFVRTQDIRCWSKVF